jgi:hypothetical protein
MVTAATGDAGPGTAADGDLGALSEADRAELEELRLHWGDAYRIGYDPDGGLDPWEAERCDNGYRFVASSASALRDAIIADYTERPVPR